MIQKVIAKLCDLDSEEEEEYSREDEEEDDDYEPSNLKAGMMSCYLTDNDINESV